MTNAMTTWCPKCGGSGCEVRASRGLKRFCEVEVVPSPVKLGGFATRAEAEAAREPGQAIVGIRAGMGHAPMRYILRGKVVR